MRGLSGQIRRAWAAAQPHQGKGEFNKVLKRFYRLAGRVRLRFLRRRAERDLLSDPGLADRICDYMRCSGTVGEYLLWADRVMSHAEQIYPDINVSVVESLLRIEADQAQSRRIRHIATEFLNGRKNIPGAIGCKALAPLLILRFGDRRSLPLLIRCFAAQSSARNARLLRSGAIVYSSYGNADLSAVRRTASMLLSNHLADVVRLVDRIRAYSDVPQRYRARLDLRYDAVSSTKYVDMRALLTVRLLHLSNAPRVKSWVATWKQRALSEPISAYDRRLINRLL